ncbi:MAG TPA: MFS transporter [Nitrososphaerales archaeon]|nr:MFS transporter [Nitrososphaerales archaeon]
MQYKWVALSVTTIGTLMSGIDTRIVIVGLPTIARELSAGAEDVIWVSQAYLLATTVGLLLIGRVTDLVGRVKIYKYGFALFTIGSAFASLSFSAPVLIASRMIQGVGSAMIITNSSAILTDATPKNELGTILGINVIAFRIGSISGLTLSGLIIAIADWRALFYINIPIGIFGTLWAHRRLREISVRDKASRMDWPGFVTFSAGLTLILLAITFLSYGSSNLLASGMLLGGAILLVFFIRLELRSATPLLDPRLFKIRSFAGGALAQLFNSLAWSGILILVSFYLQIVLGDSALQAGLSILPIDATYIVVAPLSGRLSDKYGQRVFTTAGLAISSAGFFALSFLAGTTTSYAEIALTLATMGVGNGLFISPNTSSIMGSVPANRRGIASGFRVTMLNLGLTASAGLAILLVTVGIPYDSLSSLLASFNPLSAPGALRDQFINGFKVATLVLAVLNSIAIIPSSLRGSGEVRSTSAPEVHDVV